METAKIPKFNWGELSELNSGHTPDEWGVTKKAKPRQNKIVAYDVAW